MRNEKEQTALDVYQRELRIGIAELEKTLGGRKPKDVAAAPMIMANKARLAETLNRLKDLHGLLERMENAVDAESIFPDERSGERINNLCVLMLPTIGVEYTKEDFENPPKPLWTCMERIVRDAVVGYNESYPSAPNSDCERELVERAKTANNWLTAHGYSPEPFHFDKSEVAP